MAHTTRVPGAWAPWITRVIGVWVLAGAVLKLFWGGPKDLPVVLLRTIPVDPAVLYRVAVAAEISTGLLALLRPRWSWLLVIFLLLFFDAVLAYQVVSGEASCGCFGSRISISPLVMLPVDSVLLLALLLARPWATPGSDAAGGVLVVLAVAGAGALPWVLEKAEVVTRPLTLDVRTWVGRRLADTELASAVPLDRLPKDGTWVIYSVNCEVCAKLLEDLATRERGQEPVVLLKLPPEPGEEVQVHHEPEGGWVTDLDLDPRLPWAVTPPQAWRLRGGVVVWADGPTDTERLQEELDRRPPGG